MNEKQKGRWMKRIVALCLLFCAVMVVATYIAAWFAVDTAVVMTCACVLFGGELVMTLVIKIIGDRGAKPEKKGEDEANG